VNIPDLVNDASYTKSEVVAILEPYNSTPCSSIRSQLISRLVNSGRVKGGRSNIYHNLKIVNSGGFIKHLDFVSRGQPRILSTSLVPNLNPSKSSVTDYIALLDHQTGISIDGNKAISKTMTRFTVENSIITSITYVVTVVYSHYIPVEEECPKVKKRYEGSFCWRQDDVLTDIKITWRCAYHTCQASIFILNQRHCGIRI